MDIITTDHLTKYYGKSRGIIDLSLTVRKGEFFGFIGPNGAGKSTTIRILLGLIHASSGKASIFGTNTSSDRRQILENIGYIPSEAMFYHNTTVAELLRLSANLRRKDCSAEALRLCERLQLDPNQKTDSLSLGNRKKVSIVCALQHCPDLYIFDEPTSGLDPLIQKEFFDLLRERNAQGATIFLSSHILSEVQKYCCRAAVIREGQIAACGDIAQLSQTNAKRITLTGADEQQIRRLLEEIRRTDTNTQPPASTLTNPNSEPDAEPYGKRTDIRDFRTADNTVTFLFQGNIKELMDRLAHISYTDITVTEPDLNEIFMHFYE
ncbi:MAG TPA: ABC transporter ATP-binding protein [Candidatus Mediterraneibacter stercorigallinarum]|uniref:ABC transporter ATP-binding protein n=1 Tax=Candidatus Mediterraneibacter stercorigallinarum TaxID=2838686 RepID=A0A9D2DA80_9FIRM|nr:ABC transporter ATP-binding protein [Candidatus Mediterraneibacter stercorigallinarum]